MFCCPASILWGGASASVHRQSGQCSRWPASCAFLCCEQRHVPTVAFGLGLGGVAIHRQGRRCAWGRGCSKEACERISYTFSCCSRCLLGIWTLFPRASCVWQPPALCVATVHGGFWTMFFSFQREKWIPNSPRSLTMEIEQYLAVAVCVSLRAF